MKIGIYGGAFNPLHYGHLRTAEEIFEIFYLEKVLFVPSGNTPFDKPDLVKKSHRFEMVKAATQDNPHFEVSDIEIKTRGKSYTIDTIKKLRDKYKGGGLYFILGIDAFLDLPSWKQPNRLIDLTNFVVTSRPGHAFVDLLSSPYLKDIPEKIFKELDKGLRHEISFDISKRQKVYLCKVTDLNISSSYVRNLIMLGKNIKYLLPDSVKSYIISHELYKN